MAEYSLGDILTAPTASAGAQRRPAEAPTSTAGAYSLSDIQKSAQIQKAIDEEAAQKQAKSRVEPAEPSWGKTIGAGVQKGVLGVPGIIGDVMALPSYAGPLGAEAVIAGKKYFGTAYTPEEERSVRQKGQTVKEALTPSFRMPTTEELSEKVQPYAEKYLGVGPQYEPKTASEKIVKSGLEFGIPSLLTLGAAAPEIAASKGATGLARGMTRGIVGRGVSGVGAGMASEAAGQYTEGTPFEAPARIAAAALAPKAIEAGVVRPAKEIIGGGAIPSATAQRRLGETLKEYDVEAGKAIGPLAQQADIRKTAEGLSDRMREFTSNLTGVTATGPQLADFLESFGAAERRRVYDIARNDPAAQALQASEPAGIAALRQNPIFAEAENNAIKNSMAVPSWNIQPPSGTQGGNLAYYDQIKRELDAIIENSSSPLNPQMTRREAAKKLKSQLLNEVDPMVPSYRDARDTASGTFQAASAPEAGAKFLTLADDFKIDDVKKTFDQFTDDQKQAFAVGLMTRLEQELATKNTQLITNRFLNNPQFMDKLNFVLGEDKAAAVRAKVLSENLIQQAAKMRSDFATSEAKQQAAETYLSKAKKAGLIGGLAAGAFEYQAVLNLLAQAGIPSSAAIAAFGAAGASAFGKWGMTKLENRVANRMVDLIKSNDPKDYMELNKLINQEPIVYQKLIGPIVAVNEAEKLATGKDQKAEETRDEKIQRLIREGKLPPDVLSFTVGPQQNRPNRATGGRVGNAIMKAEALIRKADQAKRSLSKATEPMLELPDEHVTKALAVAKAHI